MNKEVMFVDTIGTMIRQMRKRKGEPIRVLAAYLQIDPAIMSKMERGYRRFTKEQVEKLARYFGVDSKEMLIAWLSDRIVNEVENDGYAEEALKVAEEKLAYRKLQSLDRKSVIKKIKKFFTNDKRINRAWLFGSFARKDDTTGSDIDIMVEENELVKFSYFDLADIQYHLENLLQRKVDIGFASSIKEPAATNIRKDAILIYEKS